MRARRKQEDPNKYFRYKTPAVKARVEDGHNSNGRHSGRSWRPPPRPLAPSVTRYGTGPKITTALRPSRKRIRECVRPVEPTAHMHTLKALQDLPRTRTCTSSIMSPAASPKERNKNSTLKVTRDGARRAVRFPVDVLARKRDIEGADTRDDATAPCSEDTNQRRSSQHPGPDTMEVDSGMSTQYGTKDPSDNPDDDQVELSVDPSSSQGRLPDDAHATNPNPTMVHIADHEAEVSLDHDHPESDWTAFEERFQQTNLMIAFSINDATILVPNQGFWGLPELATGITQVAESKGVRFDAPGLLPADGQVTKLLGRPKVNDRVLWKLLRRGYIKVHGATIWISPEFTGRRQSNLDLIELEYSNANYVSVKDLHAVLQRWGAMEAIIVSHSASRVRHGKWPAIACVTNAVTDPTTGDPKFAFRLCFECSDTANLVYQGYLERDIDPPLRVEGGRTIRLAPVQNVEWSTDRRMLIRPSSASELEDLNRHLHIFGVRPEIRPHQIQDKLTALGFEGVAVIIPPGRWWGTLTMRDEEDTNRLCERYGVQLGRRIYIGNIKLFVNKPGEDGGLRCFRCDRSGHLRRECREPRYNRQEPFVQHHERETDSQAPRGRANSRWQAIAREAERDRVDHAREIHLQATRTFQQQRWCLHGDETSYNALYRPSRMQQQGTTMTQQQVSLMREMVAAQIREQSHDIVRSMEGQVQRYTHEVDARLRAHDTAIQSIQEAQETTASEVQGIAALLGRMAKHLKVPDFYEGGRPGGAGSHPEGVAGAELSRGGVRPWTTEEHVQEERGDTPESSDDSSNSEVEDVRLLLEPGRTRSARHQRGRRRRRWRPHAHRRPHTDNIGERAVLEEVLRREHYAEQFLGDRGDAPAAGKDNVIRIATTNINKGFWEKMTTEICPWFIANQLDILVVADAALPDQSEQIVWSRSLNGTKAPTLLVIGHRRVGIVIDMERWQSRWKKSATCCSPSGRSISIILRLGNQQQLQIIGTYCPDTPHRNTDATTAERLWIGLQLEKARCGGYMSVVAGDFNAYPDESMDRQGEGHREASARRASDDFRAWTTEQGLMSCFKHRFPTQPRFTYQNGSTRTALDDIYISGRHTHQIQQSSIWLYSLHRSDHVGVPFVSIALDRMQRTPARLKNVREIKVLPVKGASKDELHNFKALLADQLASGILRLIDPLCGDTNADADIQAWLTSAIDNLYKCLYQAAKQTWGERSQSRRTIDRAVSIKRTTRCHGQFKAVRRLQKQAGVDDDELRREYHRVQWPKWVIFPERIPATSPHADGAQSLKEWRLSGRPCSRPEFDEWLNTGWKLWKRTLRSRRQWRQRRRNEGKRVQRKTWMANGQVKKLLRSTIGTTLPPVQIQGGLVSEAPNYEYEESREAVEEAMTDLLNNWVPADQRTTEPIHLTTGAVEDEASLPQFVRDWMLDDIKAGGTHQRAFTGNSEWSNIVYDEEKQLWVDTQESRQAMEGFLKSCGSQLQKKYASANDLL